MRPVVGITCYVERARWSYWDPPAALVPFSYVRAVESAGGRPLLIPPSVEGVPETLEALDGIVFSGGADLDPDLYGADPHPETTGLRPDRDRGEMALMQGALDVRIPVLAICRGMQLFNVLRGGDLVQHLPEVSGEVHKIPGQFHRHEVAVGQGSRLAAIVGDRSEVASHHHQGPGRVGAGLRPVAHAPDGTVEAIEDPGGAFALGVLWHPEEDEDRALFEALVEEAARYRKLRREGR